jgi:hypothetical protein
VVDGVLDRGQTKTPAKVGPASLVTTMPDPCVPTLRAVRASTVDRDTLTWSLGELRYDGIESMRDTREATLKLAGRDVMVPVDLLSPNLPSRIRGAAWLGEDAAGPAWLLVGDGDVFLPFHFANRPAIEVPLVTTQQLSTLSFDFEADVTLRLGDEDLTFSVRRDADGSIRASGNPAVQALVFHRGSRGSVVVEGSYGSLATQLTSTVVEEGVLAIELVPEYPTRDVADWKRKTTNCPDPTLSFTISGTDRGLFWNGRWSFDNGQDVRPLSGPGPGDLGFSPTDGKPRKTGVSFSSGPFPPEELQLQLPDQWAKVARWDTRPHLNGSDLSGGVALWLLAREKPIPCTHKGRACELTRQEWTPAKCP